MNESNTIDLSEEIKSTENEITENQTITTPSDEESSKQEDVLQQALEYNDRYYTDVLTYLSGIESSERTIIQHQEEIIVQNQKIDITLSCILFTIGLVFIYNFVRNMIRA